MDAFAIPHNGPWGRTMSLEITQREMNGIYLLALKGRLVLGQESIGLRTMIDNLLSSGATRIVINLEHVNYVDSAGLGALIEMHRKTKAKGGSLKLCNLGPNLRQALEIARLLPIFETCPSETAAVASF
jgi:anti-anti-sigma factor